MLIHPWPHLPVLDNFAHVVSRVPLDRVRPNGFAAEAEEADEEVGEAQVEDEGAERGPVAVANDRQDGRHVADKRQNGHHGEHAGTGQNLKAKREGDSFSDVLSILRIGLA